ncbi:MAG: NAD(P)-binding protein [Cyanobacteria bacterium P01_F01_bin.150]
MPNTNTTTTETYPIGVIGAGPTGLATAAHLIERGLTPLVFEAGSGIAANMREFGHVRLFSPWQQLIDPSARRLLEMSGWDAPNDDDIPFAKEIVERYLHPLATLDSIAPTIKLNHKVISISRDGHDRLRDGDRDNAPFLIVAETPDGQRRFKVRSVVDASGTWTTPNPIGAGGVPADGEVEHQEHIRYAMPDVLGADRDRYAGKRVLVIGSGHSAIGSVLSLVKLAKEYSNTSIAWAVRRQDPSYLWGGGNNDKLAQRGALGTRWYGAAPRC